MSITCSAIIYKENGVFKAQCPEMGTSGQGRAIEEAVANLQEATELYLLEFPKKRPAPRTFLTTFEVRLEG